MACISKERYQRYLAEGYNRIPLVREVLADLDTPLSAYMKLAADAPYSYLLESVEGGEKWGRYSVIGLPCRKVIRLNGKQLTLESDGKSDSFPVEDPLEWIVEYQKQFKVPDVGLPRFNGGLAGFFGYEVVNLIEPRLAQNTLADDPLGTPDILLMHSDELVVFDNLRGRLYLIVHVTAEVGAWEFGKQRIADLVEQLNRAPLMVEKVLQQQTVEEGDFVSGSPQPVYEDAVRRIKDYILAGDVMQVVLSQRMSISYTAPPLHLYRVLRSMNPSPYMYYFNLGDFQVVGSSPEILARLEQNTVTVRPIAGTRPRGQSDAEDQQLEAELLADPKELAEHLMLIDLGRNDAGRVSQPGSVKVTEEMVVERYSHVMHICSHVEGQLQDGLGWKDVLQATFPAGTVSGAPKIRAMEIIAECEPHKRGIYSGAVGCLNWHGDMDTAIAIRTAIIKDGKLTIQAGAGIVADSDPAREWEETMNKGRAIFRAVAQAMAGLDNF